MPTHAFSHSPRQLTDYGLCPAAQRCWGESITPSSGFLVRRHAEIGSGTRVFCQGDRFAGVHIKETVVRAIRALRQRRQLRVEGKRVISLAVVL